MRMSGRRAQALPLMAAVLAAGLLAGCGGGSEALHNQQAGSGPVSVDPTPTPAPTAPAIAAFADAANKASCSESKNRLYIIDGKQVFWDHAGQCADAAYEQVLYGLTPQSQLCSHGDSIAGPRTACMDESLRPLFDTMLQNLDAAGLGIAGAHTVEGVSLKVPYGTAVAFKTVDATNMSLIHEARNVVVKDAAAWAKLWAEHAGADKPLPAVDFSTSMVVGVFLGYTGNACYTGAITGVTRNEVGIAVQHTDTVPAAGVVCAMYVPSPGSLVVIERSDLPVEFTTKVVPNH